MDGEGNNTTDSLLHVDKNAWEETTAQVIQSIEERCSKKEFEGLFPKIVAHNEFTRPWSMHKHQRKTKPPLKQTQAKAEPVKGKADTGEGEQDKKTAVASIPINPPQAALDVQLEDIKFIDDSGKSSLSTSLTDAPLPTPAFQPSAVSSSHSPHAPAAERSCASGLEERFCQAFISSKNEQIAESWSRHYTSPRLPPSHHPYVPKYKHEPRLVVSPLPPEKSRREKDGTHSETDFYSRASVGDSEHINVQNLYVEKDFRYYFQHPYSRLFVSYFVIFCNFLVFAEDPVSHSHTESEIPIVGNVFSFVATKYPPQWNWCVFKVLLWVIAIISGCFFGKYLIHHIILSRCFRLKMFRDEQGTWMIMFLTSLMFIYMFSTVYNRFLEVVGHPQKDKYRINYQMGITNANFMKAAASGTWIGDFVTAWMVTDMMLQDHLYPHWAKPYREFWRSHGRIRIIIFWAGSIIMTALVVTLIVSDLISWDNLNRDFVATTELSRAFLASFILVMDLLIVMQDWDFPHFGCDLDIKLPGLHAASFKFDLFQKYVNMPDVSIHVTGKWFNYSIIVFVMILDLNMWKNQIFYIPAQYGQYTGPDNKVFSIPGIFGLPKNYTEWTYEVRSTAIDPLTNRTLLEGDISMNSRYLGYPLSVKGMAFMPSLIGFAMFGILTYLYGRFPPPTERLVYGHRHRRKRKREVPRSSWRRERGNRCTHYLVENKEKHLVEKKKGNPMTEMIVAWEENVGQGKQCEKPL